MDRMPIHPADSAGSVPAGKPGEKKIDREKLKGACSDFEALFVNKMLKSMRATVPRTGLWGNDPGAEIYQDLMDRELSRAVSRRGSLNLGNLIYRQILKREEQRQEAPGVEPLAPLTRRRAEDEGR